MSTQQSMNSSTDQMPGAITVTAEEFLYQDAKDREIRHMHLIAKYDEEAANAANATKMNNNSRNMLKQKSERSIAALFSLMDTDHDDYIGMV
jgi:uncharacterized protein YceH (UPF0502 family)